MALKYQGSSQTQRGSQTTSRLILESTSIKRRSSDLLSKESHHNETNSNKTPSIDSRNSSSLFRAVAHPTQSNNKVYNILHLQATSHSANLHYQINSSSRDYATNVLTGAASLEIEIPPHMQKSLVDRYGKNWPAFDPSTRTLEVANVSSYVMVHEMDNHFKSLNWSINGDFVLRDGSGGDLFGIGTQFE